MAFWLDTVCEQILPVKIDPRHDATPRAAMACNRLGALAIRRVVGGDHIYVRDERDVRRGDPDTVQIGMPRGGGSILVQDGREAVLNPGDMVIYDSARPFTLVMEDRFNWQVFLLPKSKLRRSESELRTLTAIPMSGGSGMPGVVYQFLSRLAADIEALEADPTADALGENAADLIATLVQSQFGMPWAVSDPDGVLREQVRSFVTRNHSDHHLTPSVVAVEHGISVRRLHQLFEGTGSSVMDVVRQERLMAARRDLADPRLLHRTIEHIAHAHGLGGVTVFGRHFRAEYGETPSAFRARTVGTPFD
jgi:AraC-like DNA-binding protein